MHPPPQLSSLTLQLRPSVLHVELPELCHLRGGGGIPSAFCSQVKSPGAMPRAAKAPVDVANSSGVSPVSS